MILLDRSKLLRHIFQARVVILLNIDVDLFIEGAFVLIVFGLLHLFFCLLKFALLVFDALVDGCLCLGDRDVELLVQVLVKVLFEAEICLLLQFGEVIEDLLESVFEFLDGVDPDWRERLLLVQV